MGIVKENLKDVKEKVKETCIKKGIDYKNVTIVAVTKTVDTDIIKEAIDAGVTDIGENKVQEIQRKYEDIKGLANVHMIGHLQSNKVRHIIDKAKLIHSVDRISLMKEISKRAKAADIVSNILIQVNVSGEETKYGISIKEVEEFIKSSAKYDNIKIKGLMTIAPFTEDPEETRCVFRALKEKYDELSKKVFKNASMEYLSMGMTNDYAIALEEGSNMLRVGTAIFGKRVYSR